VEEGSVAIALHRVEVGFQKCAEIQSIRSVFWVRSTWKVASWYMETRFDMWSHSEGRSPGNMSRKREVSLLPYAGWR